MPRPSQSNSPAPIQLIPGERLYTVEELIDVHLTVPHYDNDGNYLHTRPLFGRTYAARKRFIRKLITTTREPGKIWAREITRGVYLIPERSFFEFMRGDCSDEQCPTCGSRLVPILSGDLDLLLRLKQRLESIEAAERIRQKRYEEEQKEAAAIQHQIDMINAANITNPTYMEPKNNEEEIVTEQAWI